MFYESADLIIVGCAEDRNRQQGEKTDEEQSVEASETHGSLYEDNGWYGLNVQMTDQLKAACPVPVFGSPLLGMARRKNISASL